MSTFVSLNNVHTADAHINYYHFYFKMKRESLQLASNRHSNSLFYNSYSFNLFFFFFSFLKQFSYYVLHIVCLDQYYSLYYILLQNVQFN